jgi:hypothetical protein
MHQEIADKLRLTFTGGTVEVKLAQEHLVELAKSSPEFLPSLGAVVAQHSDSSVRMAAASFLKTMRKFVSGQRERVVETILSLLLEQLTAKLRAVLGDILVEWIRSNPECYLKVKNWVSEGCTAGAPSLSLVYGMTALFKAARVDVSWGRDCFKFAMMSLPGLALPAKTEFMAHFLMGFKHFLRLSEAKKEFLSFLLQWDTLSVADEKLQEEYLSCLKAGVDELDREQWEAVASMVSAFLPQARDMPLCRSLDLLATMITNCKSFEKMLELSARLIQVCLELLFKVQIRVADLSLQHNIITKISDEPVIEVSASRLLFNLAKSVEGQLKDIVLKAVASILNSTDAPQSLLVLCIFDKAIQERLDLAVAVLPVFKSVLAGLEPRDEELYLSCLLFVTYMNPVMLLDEQHARPMLLSMLEALARNFSGPGDGDLKEEEFNCATKLLQLGQSKNLVSEPELVRVLGVLFEALQHPFEEAFLLLV